MLNSMYISNEVVDYEHSAEDIIIDEFEDDSSSISTIETETTMDESDDLNFPIFDDMWDVIFEFEERSFDEALINNKYVIGMPGYDRNVNEWLYLSGISVKGFYKFDIGDVRQYLHEYSLSYIHNPNIHIMKLSIKCDGTCNVIIKTFWLKIIQRKWKRVYKEKQEYIRKMSNPKNLMAREMGARFNCSTLYGMLTY